MYTYACMVGLLKTTCRIFFLVTKTISQSVQAQCTLARCPATSMSIVQAHCIHHILNHLSLPRQQIKGNNCDCHQSFLEFKVGRTGGKKLPPRPQQDATCTENGQIAGHRMSPVPTSGMASVLSGSPGSSLGSSALRALTRTPC